MNPAWRCQQQIFQGEFQKICFIHRAVMLLLVKWYTTSKYCYQSYSSISPSSQSAMKTVWIWSNLLSPCQLLTKNTYNTLSIILTILLTGWPFIILQLVKYLNGINMILKPYNNLNHTTICFWEFKHHSNITGTPSYY